jgi:hypothetical protein
MRRSTIVPLLACSLVFVFSKNARANDCYRLATSVDLTLNGSTHSARATGSVTCTNSNGDLEWDFGASFDGNIRIHQVNPATDFASEFHQSGEWIGSIGAPADYAVKTCYQSFISAKSSLMTGSAQSNEQCTPDPPPPPPPVPDPGPGGCVNNCDDGTFSTTGAGSEPLVINLSGPYRLSGLDDPVSFDIRANGHPLTIGWTARDVDVAFLALDRNGNGRVDDGSELFGNATPLDHGGRATNGFAALAQYDANGDGVVDAADPVWSRLLLWVDSNHNGVSEPGELRTIADSPITAVEFQYHWTGRRDQSGNRFGYEGHLHEGKRVQSFYDVFFVTASQP